MTPALLYVLLMAACFVALVVWAKLPVSLSLVATSVLLALAAGWDLASFTIPNPLQWALVAAFVVFILVCGLSPAAVGGHLLAGFLGLTLGFTLFAFGYVGGGDAKLFAVIVLWLGFHDLAAYALVASLMGGALTLLLLCLRRVPLPAVLTRALEKRKKGQRVQVEARSEQELEEVLAVYNQGTTSPVRSAEELKRMFGVIGVPEGVKKVTVV